MKPAAWRWLAGGFLVFMLGVAIAADRGTIPVWIRGIYRFPGGDWLGHFVLYGILAFLGARALSRHICIGRISIPVSVLIAATLAVLEEISQFWFPIRTPSLEDLAFGILGILCASWLARRTGK